MSIPNPFPIRPSGGAQEPAILPATIPPEVLWYFERLLKYLYSKHHPKFFKLEKHDQAKYKNQLNNLNKGQDPEKVYMTRSGKRALDQPVPVRMTKWVNPIYCNKRREVAKENRGLEDEEKLNMTRAGKWPKGRCSIVRMDQTQCMRCVRDKMKKGTDEYKYFMARSGAGKRDKQFMIRAG